MYIIHTYFKISVVADKPSGRADAKGPSPSVHEGRGGGRGGGRGAGESSRGRVRSWMTNQMK
jgi:hypothetical protein